VHANAAADHIVRELFHILGDRILRVFVVAHFAWV
jgi:hypothetical protein